MWKRRWLLENAKLPRMTKAMEAFSSEWVPLVRLDLQNNSVIDWKYSVYEF